MIKTSCGVKQGGILSPTLFNFYYDDMIIDCLKLSAGAELAGENVSIVVYADDVIILSPSLKQLQSLVWKRMV